MKKSIFVGHRQETQRFLTVQQLLVAPTFSPFRKVRAIFYLFLPGLTGKQTDDTARCI